MLPTLSHLNVSKVPENCLCFRCSSWYLQILSLLQEFHFPLTYSSLSVLGVLPKLSFGIFHTILVNAFNFFKTNLIDRLHALYAQSFWITLAPLVLPRLLARSWPGLFFKKCHNLYLNLEFYNQNSLRHSRDMAGSSFRSLSKIPHCCRSKASGPCLSPSVANHPLRSAKDLWLGEPLSHQLPNLPRARLIAVFTF